MKSLFMCIVGVLSTVRKYLMSGPFFLQKCYIFFSLEPLRYDTIRYVTVYLRALKS